MVFDAFPLDTQICKFQVRRIYHRNFIHKIHYLLATHQLQQCSSSCIVPTLNSIKDLFNSIFNKYLFQTENNTNQYETILKPPRYLSLTIVCAYCVGTLISIYYLYIQFCTIYNLHKYLLLLGGELLLRHEQDGV